MTHEPECWANDGPDMRCSCDRLRAAYQRGCDDEARAAADRVEALPWLDHGRTVNRNLAIIAARRGLLR